MGQSLEGKIKMSTSQANLGKTGKTSSKRKRRVSAKPSLKKADKSHGFFQSFTDQFNHVAPLDWVPTSYQIQIKAAKPLRLTASRKKKSKTSIH
jgi:hypothetical protein